MQFFSSCRAFATAAVVVAGLGSVAAPLQAAPDRNVTLSIIRGSYSNKPGNGAVVERRNKPYTVTPSARFDKNGQDPSDGRGTGLIALGANVLIQGGSFQSNAAAGFGLTRQANAIIKNGNFRDNYYGVYGNDGSRLLVTGGNFSENFVFAQRDTAGMFLQGIGESRIEGGTFNGNHLGLRLELSSNLVTIAGGDFSRNVTRGIQTVDNPIVITNANVEANDFDGAFICGTTARIDGGTFKGNNIGVFLTSTNADSVIVPGKLTVNGGTFSNNRQAGLSVFGSLEKPSEATINGGIFRDNGNNIVVLRGSKVKINGGTFDNRTSGGNAVAVGDAQSVVEINGGIFNAGTAAVNVSAPGIDSDSYGGTVLIKGGTFNGSIYDVNVSFDATANISGGTFNSGIINVSAFINSVANITGGKFNNARTNLDADIFSTINLYGAFAGYDTSQGPIILSNPADKGKITGTLMVELQNGGGVQTLRYKIAPKAKIVLHAPQN